MDISTSVLPEDEESMTNTKYFVYKLIDSAFTKFRNSISANFNVIMPTIVSTFFRCVDAIIILSCLYKKEASRIQNTIGLKLYQISRLMPFICFLMYWIWIGISNIDTRDILLLSMPNRAMILMEKTPWSKRGIYCVLTKQWTSKV